MAKKETTFERGLREERESMEELMKEAAPKTPLEATIDRATGFKPENMLNVARETEQADSETERDETETEKPETGTEKPETETKRRDWVEEAYKCFIKDAGDIDPTDPVKAVEAYFQKNATDELKQRCKAEGKDAKGCWRFIEAEARKALHGSSGHIDPGVVYAIAMHWFEDVPKDWDEKPTKKNKPSVPKTAKGYGQTEANGYRSNDPKDVEAARRSIILAHKRRMASPAMKTDKAYAEKVKHELDDLDKRYPVKKAKAKAKKPKQSQGFFFEMLETPVEGGQEK